MDQNKLVGLLASQPQPQQQGAPIHQPRDQSVTPSNHIAEYFEELKRAYGTLGAQQILAGLTTAGAGGVATLAGAAPVGIPAMGAGAAAAGMGVGTIVDAVGHKRAGEMWRNAPLGGFAGTTPEAQERAYIQSYRNGRGEGY